MKKFNSYQYLGIKLNIFKHLNRYINNDTDWLGYQSIILSIIIISKLTCLIFKRWARLASRSKRRAS